MKFVFLLDTSPLMNIKLASSQSQHLEAVLPPGVQDGNPSMSYLEAAKVAIEAFVKKRQQPG